MKGEGQIDLLSGYNFLIFFIIRPSITTASAASRREPKASRAMSAARRVGLVYILSIIQTVVEISVREHEFHPGDASGHVCRRRR